MIFKDRNVQYPGRVKIQKLSIDNEEDIYQIEPRDEDKSWANHEDGTALNAQTFIDLQNEFTQLNSNGY